MLPSSPPPLQIQPSVYSTPSQTNVELELSPASSPPHSPPQDVEDQVEFGDMGGIPATPPAEEQMDVDSAEKKPGEGKEVSAQDRSGVCPMSGAHWPL